MEFLSAILTQIVTYSTVYTLAALGVVLAGRTGVFNVAGEGIMLAAASAGFISAFLSGNWAIGFFFGALMGAFLGALLITLHEVFKVNQFVLGVSIVILGSGLSDLLYKLIMGVRLQAPLAPRTPRITIPFLSDIPIIGSFLNHDAIVYVMYVAVLVSWWFFYHTKIGLETRAIGENPIAADVVGINVVRRRYAATIVGAALIGIAGAYLPIVIIETYSPEIAAGRGFMAIGIAIFASWKPQRAIIGGFLFATIEVVSFQLQILSDSIPYQFFLMLPFVAVLLIMVLFKRFVEFPASVGKPYSRE
jgi:simple sugar transport system permease protein